MAQPPGQRSGAEVFAAGLILRRRTSRGDRFLLLKARKHGEWGFPKGHLEAGEDFLAAALRECVEETGIALVAIEGPAIELCYRLPDARLKRVVFYPARTSTSVVRLSREHSASVWLSATGVLARLPHENGRALFRASRQRPIATLAPAKRRARR